MKTLLLLLLPLFSQAHGTIPDIPPDASSQEYRARLSAMAPRANFDSLDRVVQAGERNLDWLEHINGFLPEGEKLSFTSKETQRGIPIDQPNEYNPALILAEFEALKSRYPAKLSAVIFEGAPFTNTPPVAVKDYLEFSRLLDRSYQSAGRWRLMQRWLPQLESRRKGDIRGIYFLSRLGNRAEKLKNFSALPEKEKAQIREWLTGMCHNGWISLRACERALQSAVDSSSDLNPLYDRWLTGARTAYDSYFRIPNYAPRSDFRWESRAGEQKLVAPFLDPGKTDVRHFVQHNVEEEWRWGEWKLELLIKGSGFHPYIEFIPGATANVNGLGGNRITMDANQPLTEYDAQWTIRHEFGHVLGLPDCYVEFYQAERQVIVNYQIDVSNIMCSRRGKVKAENVEELKRVYGR